MSTPNQPTYTIHVRRLLEIRPEPTWSAWEQFDSGLSKKTAQERLDFFKEANDAAVSFHGLTSSCEFKMEEEG